MSNKNNDTVEVVEVEKSEVALREEAMLEFWQEHDIFNKSLTAPAGGAPKGDYVFYDGPPFATGMPHYGHILAGTIKDAVPRFWTMQGYRVRRQWGWDCHGLPVENLIEKKLGLATKRDIETYGVKNFNEEARESVMEYADDWRKIVPRMGRFVDMENDYKTMDSTYTESVWWVFKSLHDKGLVFEGFKSMHLCPRCGTTLSNFEVNLGYKDIKDISVFVEFPLVDEENTSLIAWTTTPWTLPGNMALAVGKEIDYVVVEDKFIEERNLEPLVDTPPGSTMQVKKCIISKDSFERLKKNFRSQEPKIVAEFKGADLLGKKYEPPFPWLREQVAEEGEHAWTVLHADFVEVGEEGTGIVHIAPAYGEDDMKLGQAHGIPVKHHVTESGHFEDFVTDFAGQLVKPKDEGDITHMDADIEVIRALAARGRLFAKEKISHSYPHCWRCDTPLLNYATTSWFVDVPQIKDQLLAANNTVGWVPGHVGENRFGKWLEGARDWAVSRQRYWGAPLPIWRNTANGQVKIFGSLAELQKHVPDYGNQFFITRHAESALNTKGVLNRESGVENGITETGKEQVKALAAELRETGIDYIYYSPLQRTKETAEAVAAELGLSSDRLIADDRLLEMSFGEFEGKQVDEYHAFYETGMDRLTKRPEGGENWNDVRTRTGAFLYEVNAKLEGKKVLVVSHNGTMQMLQAVAKGDSAEVAAKHIEDNSYDLANAELRALPFTPMPHNDFYELDFHRPYIDEIELYDNNYKLERIPDVFDCWFESGSMPYAQFHYPFACQDTFEAENFPAQFIAEGLDQTRGWFYSLIVLGTALFGKSPYENVIVNGLVLAEDGKKMSKSLQNYPDPMELADRVGIDAMRFYLLSSPVVRGEDLSFSEKEVLELQRKNIGRLHNVLTMYQMFAAAPAANDSTHVLDRWVLARLNQLIAESTEGYKKYELDKAVRPLTDFIDDLSVWYLRRSRERLKGDDAADRDRALATLRYTLRTLALVMAPVMPFYAEYLWQAVQAEGDAESVHLGAWPEGGRVDEEAVTAMAATREVVTAALEARTKAGMKVRQPIMSVSGPEIADEYAAIVLDELNAKSYLIAEVIAVDAALTPELIAEGAVRELMRAVQGRRKTEGLAPSDAVTLTIATDEAGRAAVETHQALLTKTVGASELIFAETEGERVQADDYEFVFTILKVA